MSGLQRSFSVYVNVDLNVDLSWIIISVASILNVTLNMNINLD